MKRMPAEARTRLPAKIPASHLSLTFHDGGSDSSAGTMDSKKYSGWLAEIFRLWWAFMVSMYFSFEKRTSWFNALNLKLSRGEEKSLFDSRNTRRRADALSSSCRFS